MPALDPGWEKVRAEMQAALEPFAQYLGPRTCAHEEDWTDCQVPECSWSDSEPKAGTMPMIRDWVLVVTTEDLAENNPIITEVGSPGLRSHARTGLLYEALDSGGL